MNYTIEYFIEKFESGNRGGLMPISFEEKFHMDKLLSYKAYYKGISATGLIWTFCYKLAPTPKQRILLALEVERDLRDYEKRKP